ncbi:LysM domain-containing protein [Salix suchowensis]|nr:LysM domain-containing protein [Salix suchowensis]
MRISLALADAASLYCAMILLGMILLGSIRENNIAEEPVKGSQFSDRPCDEIYVVGEGETLNTISDKCDDPFIVEQNPHIHDPDDVYPGLVIKITSSRSRKMMKRFTWLHHTARSKNVD